MKHIFLINSHTQFLTSLGTISLKKLSNRDVIVIYSRNYRNNLAALDVQTIDLTSLHHSCMNIISNLKRLKVIVEEIDKVIENQLNGMPFTIYIPHLSYPFYQIFATHKFCQEIGLIQEAAVNYESRYKKGLKEYLYDIYNFFFLNHRRVWKTFTWRIPSFLLCERKKIIGYEISDFFTLLPIERHKVEWPSLKTDYSIDVFSPIFIFESLVEQNLIEREMYLTCIDEMVGENLSSRMYLKFHPSQNEQSRDNIRNIIRAKCGDSQIVDLPDDIPFETFLLQYSHLKICGFASSLVDFSKILGHDVRDYRELLLKSKLYREKKRILF